MASTLQGTANTSSATATTAFFSAAVWAPVCLCVVAAQATLLMPLLVGSVANRLVLDAPRTGLLASSAMLGASTAAALQILLIRRIPWRFMALALLAVQALGYASLAAHPAFAPALLAMGGLGFGFGGLLGLSQAAMAETAHQTRALGSALALMGILGSGLAALVGTFASDAAWLGLLIGVCALGVPAARGLRDPVAISPSPDSHATSPSSGGLPFLLAVLAYGLMNLANGGFWPLVERIAVAAQRPTDLIHQAVSLSLLASTAGGVAALVLGRRTGLFAPIVLTGLSTAGAVICIAAPMGASAFVASLVVFGFMWNFGPPYQLPAITAVDPAGRGMPAAVLAMKLFMAVGPFVYGVIAERAGYAIAGITAAGAALCSTLLLATLVARTPRARAPDLSPLDTRP